jgi:hypothetical protein
MSPGVSPGQDLYAPCFTTAKHVDFTGYPAVACRYAMRASTLGRSYAQECAVVFVDAVGGEGHGAGFCWIMGTYDGRGVICSGGSGGGRG